MSLVRRLRRVGAGERGFTLVEMLTVMAILGVVLTGITTLFVAGLNSEVDMNNRFQAQVNARVALDRLRREVHCANAISPSGATSAVTLTLPSYCKNGTGAVIWCAVAVGGSTTRYALYRSTSDPCGDSADRKYADYLTSSSVFDYTVQSSQSLGKMKVTLAVDLNTAKPGDYKLQDSLVLRNSTRTCITGSPSPPC
jgi:prepilin-type N-terminal cleavage/methylation domain-containing protein